VTRPSALAAIRSGDKRALSAALARIETDPDAAETLALLEAAWSSPRAHVIGVTGPPGVGKSTLTAALIGAWRKAGARIGVIAVDPSSKLSGGALLGDRLRLAVEPDEGLFIRSMAARDRLGGLAPDTVAAAALMRAAFDRVLIETVGVGQSETDIALVADTVLLCLQPGSGDVVQFMKAGIVEIPDAIVVTKADLGAPAQRSFRDARSALGKGLREDQDWQPPVLLASASAGTGIDDLLAAIEHHRDWLEAEGRLAKRRRTSERRWLEAALRDRFGSEGLARLGAVAEAASPSPFARLREFSLRLRGATGRDT
jgi:LAO/AO transport system kinase